VFRRVNDRDVVERLVQDLKVKARDIDDFMEKKKLQKIIDKFQKGMEEEFKDSY
jgi:hypothetical protein